MGLTRRQRTRPQTRAVIDRHNQHDPKVSWHQIDERRKKEQDKRWRQDASEAPRRG
jgi:hypothetical protein